MTSKDRGFPRSTNLGDFIDEKGQICYHIYNKIWN